MIAIACDFMSMDFNHFPLSFQIQIQKRIKSKDRSDRNDKKPNVKCKLWRIAWKLCWQFFSCWALEKKVNKFSSNKPTENK